jgi:hypothetical protein
MNINTRLVWLRASGVALVFLVLVALPQDLSAQCQIAYSDGSTDVDYSVVYAWSDVMDFWSYGSGECDPGTPFFEHYYDAYIQIAGPDNDIVYGQASSQAYGGGGSAEAWTELPTLGRPGLYTFSFSASIYCTALFGFILSTQGGGTVGVPQVTVTLSPSPFYLSTGDTNKTITTTRSPSITFTPSFTVGTTSNPNSTCQASLAFSNNSGTGSVNTTVTASPAGCSGIFDNVRATVNGVQSNGIQIAVPPQLLIQLLHGEAGGQNDWSQQAVGRTAFNRMGDPDFGNHTTWQAVITAPNQFNGIPDPTMDGPTQELNNAGLLFTGQIPNIVGNGAKCFWSPTFAEWQNIAAALQSQTTVYPANVGSSGCWSAQGNMRQIIYNAATGTNMRGGVYAGAPAFVFLRLKGDPTDPAVVEAF